MIAAIDLLGLEMEELTWYQMGIRAIIVFVIALIYIRLSGMRTFGTQSAFDVVVSITLGGILSRCITGKFPFFPCLFAAAVLVVLHQFTAYLTYKNKHISQLTLGDPVLLYAKGKRLEKNLQRYRIADRELEEALHKASLQNFDKVELIWLEPSGEICIIKKGQ